MDIHSLLLNVFYKPITNIKIDFPGKMHIYTHYVDDYTFYLFLYAEGIKGWDACMGRIDVVAGDLLDTLHIDIPASDTGVFCRRVCTRIKVRHSVLSRGIVCPPSVRGFTYTIEGLEGGAMLVAHAQYLSSSDMRLVIQRVDSFSGWKSGGQIIYTFGGKRYKAEIQDSTDCIQYTIRTFTGEYLNPLYDQGGRVAQPIILESLVQEPIILSHLYNTVCSSPGSTWECILVDDFKNEFMGTEFLDTYMRIACNSMKIQMWQYIHLYKYGGHVVYPNIILNGGRHGGFSGILDLVKGEEGIYPGYIYSKKQCSLFSEVLLECKRGIGEYSSSSPDEITGARVIEKCFNKIYSAAGGAGIQFRSIASIDDNGIQAIDGVGRIFHSIMSGDMYSILQDAYLSGRLYMRRVDHCMKPFMNGKASGPATNVSMYVNGASDNFSIMNDIINDNTLSIRIKRDGGYGGWKEQFNIFIEDKESGRIQKKVIEASSVAEKVIQCRVPWTLKAVPEYGQKIPKNIYVTWKDYYLDKNIYGSYMSVVEHNPEYTVHMYSDHDARAFLIKHFNNDVVCAFDALIPGSFKADLWRYCVLYERGGVYVDHKVKFRGSLRDVIGADDEMVFPLDADKKHVQIGFMAFIPKHPFLKYVIDKTVENIKKEMIGLRDLDITGPIHFARCCMQFYAVEELANEKKLYEGHRWLWLNEDASHIYTNEGSLIADYHYKEYLSTRKDHYSYFWNNKTIYKIDSRWLR